MKKTNGFGLFGVIVIIIITALVSSIATGVIMLNNSSINTLGETIDLTKDEDLQEFIQVYETILSKYYDEIDKKAMLEAAEEGMLDFLGDKYTTYLEDSEYEEIINELSGTYNGIGVAIKGNSIVNVTPSSPAEKAGILANDTLIKVNDIDVQNMNSEEIVALIKNNETKIVNLEISRNGDSLHLSITKEDLENVTVSYQKLENTNIGYISLQNFSENLDSQVSKALTDLESQGINSLIIDVRDNVGGYLSAAEDTASLFLSEGKNIYSLQTSENKFTYSDKTKEKRTYPIVVLMNGNSASASEILAAALKESYGATLVGTKSYGKGKVQQVLSLNSGDSVKVSTAKWLTPNGDCIDGIGIMPDYNVVFTGVNQVDEQLNKAIELLQN